MNARIIALLASLSVAAPAGSQSWCDHPYRPGYERLERVAVSDSWFHVYRVDRDVLAIYEPFNFQEIISYLIVGSSKALLFDTGMGMSGISGVVEELTRLPVTVVNSHTHYDHIGGNAEFPNVAAMVTEFTRASAKGIPHASVAQEVAPDAICTARLKVKFDTATYRIRPFKPSSVIGDGSVIDLGNRKLEVLSVPGHTPDAIALLDRANKQVWTGDTFYAGPIWLYFPGTDLDAYGKSIARLAALAPTLSKVFPAHNFPTARPEVLPRVRDAFMQVRDGRVKGSDKGKGLVEYAFDGFSFLLRKP